MSVEQVRINIDGASKGNPGRSGIGVVMFGPGGAEIKRLSRYIGTATNNVAEYTALIHALQEALALGARRVVVHSDSELLVRQISGEYRVRNGRLRELKSQFENLRGGFSSVRVEHVGRSENKSADMLANRAVDDHDMNAGRAGRPPAPGQGREESPNSAGQGGR